MNATRSVGPASFQNGDKGNKGFLREDKYLNTCNGTKEFENKIHTLKKAKVLR
jgi:hypothetical protein